MTIEKAYCTTCKRDHYFGFDAVGQQLELLSCAKGRKPVSPEMIDTSKLPAGPYKRTPIHDVVAADGETVAITPGGASSEALNRYAVASLLIWARSIVEPPQEVREAMERLRTAEECEHKIGVPSPLLIVADWQTVANWTLKIFSEVNHE